MKLVILLSAMISFNSQAQVLGGGSVSSGNSVAPSSSIPTLTDTEENSPGGEGVSCDDRENEEDGYVLSYRFLKTISDSSLDENKRVEVLPVEGKDKFVLKINKFVKTCTKLTVPKSQKIDKNVFVSVKNTFKFSKDRDLLKYLSKSDEYKKYVKRNKNNKLVMTDEWKNVPHDIKYNLCMHSKGMISSDSEGNEFIDFKKANSKGDFKSSMTFGSHESIIDAPIGKGDESINLFFASGEATAYSSDEDDKVDPNYFSDSRIPSCRVVENFGGAQPWKLFESERDKILKKLYTECKEGNVQGMLNAEEELKRNGGNIGSLLDKIGEITSNIQIEQSKEIYDRLEEINKEIKDPDLSSDEVKELAEEYAMNVRELDTLVLEPAKEQLRNLMVNRGRGELSKKEYKNAIKEPIESLEKFGKMFGEDHTNVHKALRNNLDSEASDIFLDLYKEAATAKAYVDEAEISVRSKKYKGDNAREKIIVNIETDVDKIVGNFEVKKIDRWELQYRAYNGDISVVDGAIESEQALLTKINKDYIEFMDKEREDYNKYCGRVPIIGIVKRPEQCRDWQAGSEKRNERFMAKQDRDLESLAMVREDFEELKGLYNDHYKRKLEDDSYEEETMEDWGLVGFVERGRRSGPVDELPRLADGSPIEDYYSFRHQQDYINGTPSPVIFHNQAMSPWMTSPGVVPQQIPGHMMPPTGDMFTAPPQNTGFIPPPGQDGFMPGVSPPPAHSIQPMPGHFQPMPITHQGPQPYMPMPR